MTWGQIKKDLQMYGQRLCYSNNSICCSFTPCVDVVIAAAAADFPGLPNRPAAAGRPSRPSGPQHREVPPPPGMGSTALRSAVGTYYIYQYYYYIYQNCSCVLPGPVCCK